MIIKCPFCSADNEVNAKQFLITDPSQIFRAHTCIHCKKTFEMYCETRIEELLTKETCDVCGHPWEIKSMNRRETCFPFPLNPELNNICPSCYARTMLADLEARTEYGRTMSLAQQQRIKKNFHVGTLVQVNKVMDPYVVLKEPIVVPILSIIHGVIIVRLPNGDLCNLYDGFDDFVQV